MSYLLMKREREKKKTRYRSHMYENEIVDKKKFIISCSNSFE